MNIILSWIISTMAILLSAYLLIGVHVNNLSTAFLVALVLGIINAIIKPVLLILTLPINVLTLGLFTLVINALLIELAATLIPGFIVDNFWWALLFGIVLSLINTVLHKIF